MKICIKRTVPAVSVELKQEESETVAPSIYFSVMIYFGGGGGGGLVYEKGRGGFNVN